MSRYAGWWAFEHFDSGNGFEGGYKTWARSVKVTACCFRVLIFEAELLMLQVICSLPTFAHSLRTQYRA